jgi:ABC-2 type transport system permease protein
MSLLVGELQRALARRLVKVLALLVVLGCALAGILVFVNTEDVSPAEVAARRQAAATAVERCVQGEAPTVDGRLRGPPPGSPERSEFCQFAAGRVEDSRFRLRSLKGVLQGTTAAGVVAAWLIGASVIGSDWQTRALTTLLTWEPRRAKVLLTKALASIAVAGAFFLLGQALLSAALLPSAFLHGTTEGAGWEWFRSVLGVLGRGTGLVAIAGAIGFSVAAIGRNTAAALGIGFAYFLIIENVVGSFLEDFRRWLLLGNAIVLVSGEDGGGEVIGRTVVVAAVYLTVVAVGLLAASTVVFQRRDVA